MYEYASMRVSLWSPCVDPPQWVRGYGLETPIIPCVSIYLWRSRLSNNLADAFHAARELDLRAPGVSVSGRSNARAGSSQRILRSTRPVGPRGAKRSVEPGWGRAGMAWELDPIEVRHLPQARPSRMHSKRRTIRLSETGTVQQLHSEAEGRLRSQVPCGWMRGPSHRWRESSNPFVPPDTTPHSELGPWLGGSYAHQGSSANTSPLRA